MSFNKDLENSSKGLTGRKTFTCLNSSEESEWLCGNLLGQLVVVVRQDAVLQIDLIADSNLPMFVLNWLWVDEAQILELGRGVSGIQCNKVILNDRYKAARQGTFILGELFMLLLWYTKSLLFQFTLLV